MEKETPEEYQERMGSPEMEYLQHQTDFPEQHTPQTTPDTEKEIKHASHCPCGKCHPTPDTEWESRVRAEWDLYDNGRFGHLEGVIQIIEELLSSRDTYWKERVRKNVGDYANQKFIEGKIVDPLELYEAITNEDNLK